MEDRKIQFIDRLKDRGFVDQWSFIAFASVGFAGIISGKWLGGETAWVAIGAIILMLAYAVVVGWSGTGRVRADQAGDNCYYLGLIYTLASLSYAIATFDPNDTASTIVQGFGIALATTIFGLILRVFFSQGRPDLENVEEQARLELTDAATRLKTELREAARQMKDFTVGLQQSLTETHQAATQSMEAFTKASVDGLNSVVESANEVIRAEANDFAARSKRYEASFGKLLGRLEGYTESLDTISAAHDKLREAAELTQSAVASSNTHLADIAEAARQANTAVDSIRATSTTISQSAERLQTAVGELETGLRSVTSETEKQLSLLRSGPGQTVEAALNALAVASKALSAELATLTSTSGELTNQLSDQGRLAIESAKRHAEALDQELARSREATVKVHGALVAMTDTLASHVEGRT
jgi:hypothetical protein